MIKHAKWLICLALMALSIIKSLAVGAPYILNTNGIGMNITLSGNTTAGSLTNVNMNWSISPAGRFSFDSAGITSDGLGDLLVNGTIAGNGSGLTNIPVAGLSTNGSTTGQVPTSTNGTVVWMGPPGVGLSPYPSVFTNKDSGVNLTLSGSFSTNLLIFTTPSGVTNLWEITVSSPLVSITSSYTAQAQMTASFDGFATPEVQTLWVESADSTIPPNVPIIARITPNTTVTIVITGSGGGSMNLRGRTTATAWIISPN